MSCEKGFRAIIDEANWQLLGEPRSPHDFYRETVGAAQPLRAGDDHLPGSQCVLERCNPLLSCGYSSLLAQAQKYLKPTGCSGRGQPSATCRLDPELLPHTEGRGKNCVVEPFRRGELDYFFAYPEDYSQQSIEWVNGEFDRRPHNPAFEVIYVYSQKEGSLDLNFRGSYKCHRTASGDVRPGDTQAR